MNRNHNIQDYLNIYEKLIKINPMIKFSSDFIIAYPGEDENDFNRTLELVKKLRFVNSFSFIFSPRPGTIASKLKTIDNKISLKRLQIIQKALFNNQINMNKSLENKIIDVLVENKNKKDYKFFGRTEYMTSAIFDANDEDVGKIISIKIISSNQNTLFGKKVHKSKLKVA
jgi:tRNA-2-methylthio-N6-dimethylallyladenosine synthase